MRASLARLDAAAAATDHVALAPAARRTALAQQSRDGARAVVVPLRLDVPETQSPDVATGLRDRLGLDRWAGGPVATHLVGQGALWAGLQDVSKSDLAQAESTGLPIGSAVGARLTGRRGVAPDAPAARSAFWTRWTAAAMRRPIASVVVAATVLLALAAPALALRSDNGALRRLPPGNETRRGFEAAARVTGPGAGSPVQIVLPRGQAAGAVRIARADPEAARVAAPVVSPDRAARPLELVGAASAGAAAPRARPRGGGRLTAAADSP